MISTNGSSFRGGGMAVNVLKWLLNHIAKDYNPKVLSTLTSCNLMNFHDFASILNPLRPPRGIYFDFFVVQVIGDNRLGGNSNLLEAPTLRHEHTSVSCPIIEHTETRELPTIGTNSCALMDSPLSKPCDIKLVINGCTYNDKSEEAGIPLLADAQKISRKFA